MKNILQALKMTKNAEKYNKTTIKEQKYLALLTKEEVYDKICMIYFDIQTY